MTFSFFSYQGFFSQTVTIHRTAQEGSWPYFIPLYQEEVHRYLIETLNVQWWPRIFNRIVYDDYQTVTRWDLPPFWISISLIDYAKVIYVCLLDDLILDFCYSSQWRIQNLVQTGRYIKSTKPPPWSLSSG